MNDTIAALSSGRPPAAIAVIRSSGPDSIAVLSRLIEGPIPEPRRAVLRRLIDPSTGMEIDRAVIVVFPGPASVTGEDVVEYQCHGSRAIVDRLLEVLAGQQGCRIAEPGEFTRRALTNGRLDLTEAEGLADLLEAETESQRHAALITAEGGIRRQAEVWRRQLVDLSAMAEAAIDYIGEDDETAIDVNVLAAQARHLVAELRGWLDRPRVERLKDGIRVVLAGPPNVGKSSLVNALIEENRAIVTPAAGTTRDVIEVPVSRNGIPFLIVDTAGIRDSASDQAEMIGIGKAEAEVRKADIVLWLGEGPVPSHPGLIEVSSKADLPGGKANGIRVSSETGEGVCRLWSRIAEYSATLLPREGEVALNRRQAECLSAAASDLEVASKAQDLVIVAHHLSLARQSLDRLTGRSGVEDMLDALFARFCLGK